ncbi:hypothetical protein ACIQU6_03340 [Streptomyces sp. NPDC090442]|uniref:hypothetical protein n=1 Tax=Streptomyces sp. NPDC090442 TaxID=3365962 RepID=UPI00382DFCB5
MSCEHETTNCHQCNAEAHEAAVKKHAAQDSDARTLSPGLVIAATLAIMAVVVLWIVLVTLLSYLAG